MTNHLSNETNPTKPQSRVALLAQIEAGFAALWELIASLNDEGPSSDQDSPEWSAKDVITHIAAWERVVLRYHLGQQSFADITGLPGAEYRVTDEDILNDHFRLRNAALAVPEAKAALLETHSRLMEALQALPQHVLFEKIQHPDMEQANAEPLIDYVIANTYEHYAEHMIDLRSIPDLA